MNFYIEEIFNNQNLEKKNIFNSQNLEIIFKNGTLLTFLRLRVMGELGSWVLRVSNWPILSLAGDLNVIMNYIIVKVGLEVSCSIWVSNWPILSLAGFLKVIMNYKVVKVGLEVSFSIWVFNWPMLSLVGILKVIMNYIIVNI